MNSNLSIRFKLPLTRADLVSIQERNSGSADVRALLWEVKRFRALALYVDQLQRILGTLPSPAGRRFASYPRAARGRTLRERVPPVSDRRGFRMHRLRARTGGNFRVHKKGRAP